MRFEPNRRLLLGSAGLAGIAALSAAGRAGPLTPPAGAVTGTSKPLNEVEPRTAVNSTNTPGDATSLYRISQPGSYYLVGNVAGVSGKHGIVIAASGVTLDLSGFDLGGPAGVGGFSGVATSVAGLWGITVRNGSVHDWSGDGIDLKTNAATCCLLENIHARSNAGDGMACSNDAAIHNCTARLNGGFGINAQSGCSVSGCVAAFNSGLAGITVTNSSTVHGCTAQSNASAGITANSGSVISGCTAGSNSGAGFSCGFGVLVEGSYAFGNSSGLITNPGTNVRGCCFRLNTTVGVSLGSRCGVHDCLFEDNGGTTAGNAGISAGFDCVIAGNTVVRGPVGIKVTGTGCLIIGNRCSADTSNWSIAAGNSLGPIVVAGTNAAAINGNGPAPSTLGTADPHTNFSF